MHALLLLLVSQPLAAAHPPVRIWLGSGPMLASGAEERVYVQTSSDGNLVVLHARPDGRVEVLFPGSPTGDPFVRAGTYEIRGPIASTPAGRGIVVAALSPDPIWFDEFGRNNTWEVSMRAGADPEAFLTDVVQRMLGDGSFNYDVATTVSTTRTVRAIPLVARTRLAAAAAAAATRSLLLVRFVHSGRSHEAAAPSIVAPAAPGPASPAPPVAPPPAMNDRIVEPAAAAAPLLVYEAQFLTPDAPCAIRPDVHSRGARASTATAAPPAAQGGLSVAGVGLGAVHTAGWRH